MCVEAGLSQIQSLILSPSKKALAVIKGKAQKLKNYCIITVEYKLAKAIYYQI